MVLMGGRGADPEVDAAIARLGERLSARSASSVAVARPPSARRFPARGSVAERSSVDLMGRADVAGRVGPAGEAGARCLVCRLPREASGRRVRPLAALAAYATQRQPLSARLRPRARELVADAAVALWPTAVLLVGERAGAHLALATADPLAAELAWLALQPADPAMPTLGPWEDPVVQRATQLGVGVRVPGQLELVAATAPSSGACAPLLAALLDQLRLRLGVP